MYDQAPVYAAVENHSPGARVIIPPRKDAVLSLMTRSSSTLRDQHILEIERAGRFAWKRTLGYYDQAYAENAFTRYQRTFGGSLRAKLTAPIWRLKFLSSSFPCVSIVSAQGMTIEQTYALLAFPLICVQKGLDRNS